MKRKMRIPGKDAFGWLLICLSILMLGKSMTLCFSQDIWYDELFTVGMIEHSYGELIHFTAADVHPPLYYCVTKLFVDLCKLIIPGAGTVIPAKIVSVLPYCILLLYSVTFIRKRFGIFTGGMFLYCIIAMPQMSAYTVEVRMYGWALLFVTAAFLHSYGCVTEGFVSGERTGRITGATVVKGMDTAADRTTAKESGVREEEAKVRHGRGRYVHGAALVFYGLAAAYTQYFACVAVIMVYLYVLIAFLCRNKSRIKEWAVYVAISIVGYVPWLYALAGQIAAVRENYWILPLTWRSLGGCVKFLMKPAFANEVLNVVLAVVLFTGYLAVVGAGFIKCVKNIKKGRDSEYVEEESKVKDTDYVKDGKNPEKIGSIETLKNEKVYHNGRVLFGIAGLFVLAGVVIFGFAASILIRPVFVYRYMIPAMGCFWLCFAICLEDILCKLWRDKDAERKDTVIKEINPGRLHFMQGALMTLTILLVVVGLRDYRAFMGEEEYKILLMKDAESALSQIGPHDIVIYNFDQVQAVTSYYLEDTTERYLWKASAERLIQEIIGPCETVEDAGTIKDFLISSKDAESAERRVWFIGSFNSRDDIVAQWQESGLTVEETGSFLLERYWFNFYEISL